MAGCLCSIKGRLDNVVEGCVVMVTTPAKVEMEEARGQWDCFMYGDPPSLCSDGTVVEFAPCIPKAQGDSNPDYIILHTKAHRRQRQCAKPGSRLFGCHSQQACPGVVVWGGFQHHMITCTNREHVPDFLKVGDLAR